MPQKVLSMRKIKEVLRLRYDLGLLQNEIARERDGGLQLGALLGAHAHGARASPEAAGAGLAETAAG